MRSICFILYFFTVSASAFSQQRFVISKNEEFKNQRPRNGVGRYYLQSRPDIWEAVDSSLKEQHKDSVLLCVEGEYRNGSKENIFTGYLIDAIDHSKRYKVWEQTYYRNKLNGEWRIYSLTGTLVYVLNYKNDSLSGIARRYRPDGIRTLEEREYSNGRATFNLRKFDDSGRLEQVMVIENKRPNGPGKRFYKNGQIKEEVFLVDGKMVGSRKYYHANGQLWSELEYKEGKPWNLISNYNTKGVACNGGTLKEGTGTLNFYHADGTLRETLTYVGGEKIGKSDK